MIIEPILMKNLLSEEQREKMKNVIFQNVKDGKYSRDQQVPTAVAVRYREQVFEQIHKELMPFFETVAKKKLLPTYTYFRLYDKGDELKPHRDRAACQISVTLQVWSEDDEDWPIYTSTLPEEEAELALDIGEAIEWVMKDGDGVMYPGVEVTHFRLPHVGKKQIQVFLHYVDANGPYAWAENDNRIA